MYKTTIYLITKFLIMNKVIFSFSSVYDEYDRAIGTYTIHTYLIAMWFKSYR